jgi:hypothetical protein
MHFKKKKKKVLVALNQKFDRYCWLWFECVPKIHVSETNSHTTMLRSGV